MKMALLYMLILFVGVSLIFRKKYFNDIMILLRSAYPGCVIYAVFGVIMYYSFSQEEILSYMDSIFDWRIFGLLFASLGAFCFLDSHADMASKWFKINVKCEYEQYKKMIGFFLGTSISFCVAIVEIDNLVNLRIRKLITEPFEFLLKYLVIIFFVALITVVIQFVRDLNRNSKRKIST